MNSLSGTHQQRTSLISGQFIFNFFFRYKHHIKGLPSILGQCVGANTPFTSIMYFV